MFTIRRKPKFVPMKKHTFRVSGYECGTTPYYVGKLVPEILELAEYHNKTATYKITIPEKIDYELLYIDEQWYGYDVGVVYLAYDFEYCQEMLDKHRADYDASVAEWEAWCDQHADEIAAELERRERKKKLKKELKEIENG